MPVMAETNTKITPCHACPLQELKTFRDFTPVELDFIQCFKSGELTAEAHATILVEGTNSPHLYTILSGWAFRYKILEDGGRQILNFALPGDFLGLQGAVFATMGHSVEALTRATLCVFPRDKLWTLYEKHPNLAFDVTWLSSREERMVDEHLLAVGRRSATERVSFLLMSLFQRCKQVGFVKANKTNFPLTQQHIADALGLSVVHTNKVLRKLSDQGLIKWKSSTFELQDEESLRKISMYEGDESYLRPFL